MAVSCDLSTGGVSALSWDSDDNDKDEPYCLVSSVYEQPRHHTGSLMVRLLTGSRSHIRWRKRRPTRPTSAAPALAASIALASFGEVLDIVFVHPVPPGCEDVMNVCRRVGLMIWEGCRQKSRLSQPRNAWPRDRLSGACWTKIRSSSR